MAIDLQKWLHWGGLGLVIAGVVIASESLPLPLPRPLALGTTLMGTGLALAFVDAMFLGEITFSRRGFSPEVFQGLAARLWGALMLLIGAALAVGGLIEFSLPGSLVRWAGTPTGIGSLVAVAGSAVAVYGLIHVLGPAGEGRTGWQQLAALPGMAIYALVTLSGLALLAAGLIQLAQPEVARAAVETVRQAIPPIPTPPPLP